MHENELDKMQDKMIEDLWEMKDDIINSKMQREKIVKIFEEYCGVEKLKHFDINLLKSFY